MISAERRQLQIDHEMLTVQEENLREYEARLRQLLQPAAETEPAPSPARRGTRSPHEDPALHAAWQQLHRARELLEAEQAVLRDERMKLRERDVAVMHRENLVANRERAIEELEQSFAPRKPAVVERSGGVGDALLGVAGIVKKAARLA